MPLAEPEPVPLPEPLPLPEPEPLPELLPEALEVTPAPLEETLIPDETPVIVTAPTILASPETAQTPQELEIAIPQSQAAKPIFRPVTPPPNINQPRPRPVTPPPGGLSLPSQPLGGILPPLGSTGGAGGQPPGGGTPRTPPGAQGWTLSQPLIGEGEGGYRGLNLDIRCREAKRTHEDCPEYIRKFSGRNADGSESFGPHAPRGSTIATTISPRSSYNLDSSGRPRPIGGGNDPWNPNLVDRNSPNITAIDNADFGRLNPENNLNSRQRQQPQGRVRDFLTEPGQKKDPWKSDTLELPPSSPPETDDDE